MKKVFALLLVAVLSGCATRTVVIPAPRITDQRLLEKCPETLPTLSDGKGATILKTMTEWGIQYQHCQQVHNSLVNAIQVDPNKS